MKKQLLLVAYQCGPNMGSVSQIGWEWYNRLAQQHQVTLVTHIRNKAALDSAKAPVLDSRIIYIDTEWFAGPLYRFAKKIFPRSEHSVFLVSSLDYFVFDYTAHRQLKQEMANGQHWDVLHRVTPITLAAPTRLGRLGIPTVLGPLNSGLSDPTGFKEILKQEVTWLSKLRQLSYVLDSFIGSTRNAQRILTANNVTKSCVSRRYHHRCLTVPENGISLSKFKFTPWPKAPDAVTPLNVLFVGRLTPVKGLNMLIQAVAKMHHTGGNVELNIVGDGPMRQEWEALSKHLGLKNVVKFHGNQPHEKIAGFMQACHVFCLPCIRESGGAVLLEAMASARPVIALNHGGPSEIVSSNEGVLLPLSHPEQVIYDLAETLMDIPENPSVWRVRGVEGLRRVESTYSWHAKLNLVDKVYSEVLAERGV